MPVKSSEFTLIEKIRNLLATDYPENIVIGIGDDAAVIKPSSDKLQLQTCDMQVEGTHFRLDWIEPEVLGRRVISVNISDIAAMGGTPLYALISLALPDSCSDDFLDSLLKGIKNRADEFGVRVIGGNLAGGVERCVIDVFMTGEVDKDTCITRSGAAIGNRVFVTGVPGAGAGGYYVLDKYGRNYPDKFEPLVQAYLDPQPCAAAGRLLAGSGMVTAMIDVSDGLSGDMIHICEASGVGVALLESKLRSTDQLDVLAREAGLDALELALHGGDSYELLFTVRDTASDAEVNMVLDGTGTTAREIGRITPAGEGCCIIHRDGSSEQLNAGSWDHFRA